MFTCRRWKLSQLPVFPSSGRTHPYDEPWDHHRKCRHPERTPIALAPGNYRLYTSSPRRVSRPDSRNTGVRTQPHVLGSGFVKASRCRNRRALPVSTAASVDKSFPGPDTEPETSNQMLLFGVVSILSLFCSMYLVQLISKSTVGVWLAVPLTHTVVQLDPMLILQANAALLLLFEVVYMLIHIKPLWPLLFQPSRGLLARRGMQPVANVEYLASVTTAFFFICEVTLLCMLAASPLLRSIPTYVFAVHLLFHVLYTLIASLSPRWALKQNVDRINQALRQERASAPRFPDVSVLNIAIDGTVAGLLLKLWNSMLNTLNFADFALHLTYTVLILLNSPLPPLVNIALILAGYMLYEGITEPSSPITKKLFGYTLPPRRVMQGGLQDVDLTDKVYLVTGGASGIGYETAKVLVEAGAKRVLITSRDFGKARMSALRISNKCKINSLDKIIPFSLDITRPDSIKDFARALVEELGVREERLDCLINNAGSFSLYKAMDKVDDPAQRSLTKLNDQTFASNFVGHVWLTEELLSMLSKHQDRPPRVVNVSSGIHVLAKVFNSGTIVQRILMGTHVNPFTSYVHAKWLLISYGDYISRNGYTGGLRYPGWIGSSTDGDGGDRGSLDVVSIHPGTVLTMLVGGILPVGSGHYKHRDRRFFRGGWINCLRTRAHALLETLLICKRNRRRAALCVANAATVDLARAKSDTRSGQPVYFSGWEPTETFVNVQSQEMMEQVLKRTRLEVDTR